MRPFGISAFSSDNMNFPCEPSKHKYKIRETSLCKKTKCQTIPWIQLCLPITKTPLLICEAAEHGLLLLPPGLQQVTLAAKITDRKASAPSQRLHAQVDSLKQHVNFLPSPLKQKPSSMEGSKASHSSSISCRLRLCKTRTVPVCAVWGSRPKTSAHRL